jgi:hypothetical protein
VKCDVTWDVTRFSHLVTLHSRTSLRRGGEDRPRWRGEAVEARWCSELVVGTEALCRAVRARAECERQGMGAF